MSIKDLPVEVLELIFDFVTGDPTSPHPRRCPSPFKSSRDIRSLLSTSNICHLWREISLHRPRPWTIPIDQNAEMSIVASSGRPLSMFSSEATCEGCLRELLAPNRARVKELDIQSTRCDLTNIMANPFPILECLRISRLFTPATLQPTPGFESHFPHLTHLFIDPYCSISRSWADLPLAELRLMLTYMPSLESLHLHLPTSDTAPPTTLSPVSLTKLRDLHVSYTDPAMVLALYRILDPPPTVAVRLDCVFFSASKHRLEPGLLPAPFALDGFTDITWSHTHQEIWLVGAGGQRGPLRMSGEWGNDGDEWGNIGSEWLPWVEALDTWMPSRTLQRLTVTLFEWRMLAKLLKHTPALVSLAAICIPYDWHPRDCWTRMIPLICGALTPEEGGIEACCPRLAELTICTSDLVFNPQAPSLVLAMAQARDRAGRRLETLTLDMDGLPVYPLKALYPHVGASVGALVLSEAGGEARFRPAVERWWAMDDDLPWFVEENDRDAGEDPYYPWTFFRPEPIDI